MFPTKCPPTLTITSLAIALSSAGCDDPAEPDFPESYEADSEGSDSDDMFEETQGEPGLPALGADEITAESDVAAAEIEVEPNDSAQLADANNTFVWPGADEWYYGFLHADETQDSWVFENPGPKKTVRITPQKHFGSQTACPIATVRKCNKEGVDDWADCPAARRATKAVINLCAPTSVQFNAKADSVFLVKIEQPGAFFEVNDVLYSLRLEHLE